MRRFGAQLVNFGLLWPYLCPMSDIGMAFKDIPLNQLHPDPNQPRKDFGTKGDENRLFVSIKEIGIQQPLTVKQRGTEDYLIAEGHRRYLCAKRLGLKTVPCRIYTQLHPGEFERIRFEIQNNRRPWKPLERAEALHRIKEIKELTNEQLAKFLYMSKTVVSNSLTLRKEKAAYRELMEQYNLSEVYQVEFVRLRPKVRKIRELDIDRIIRIIFEKAQHKIIKSAREFRTLGSIFLRASANEEALHRFLKDQDMTVKELAERAVHTGISLWAESLIQYIAGKLKDGVQFSSDEKKFFLPLRDLLNKVE